MSIKFKINFKRLDELLKTMKYLNEDLALGSALENAPNPITLERENLLFYIIRKDQTYESEY